MTISADIGLAPWDVLAMGISYHTGLTYGNALILSSVVVIAIDLIMKEKIGYGTIFDAILVGKFADMFTYFKIVSKPDSMIFGIAIFIIGLFVMAIGQFFYMSSAQGCGPRDTLLIGMGKRLRKFSIGVVNTMILCVVLAAGIALGGPIGMGTVLAAFGMGTALQIICNIIKFEPRDVVHKNIFETTKLIFGKN